MTMDAFHPDHLRPGDMVGAWRIQKSLGSGGMGHVFHVEQKGHPYVLKMALRPASAEVPPGDEDIDLRMGHEAAFHLSHETLSGVLRVVEVSRWPDVREGYRTLVSEYVEGETFHEWRWRTRPSAAKLLEIFEGLVRTVAELHRRGVHHRDLKADNILVRREDERPFLIDFGVVSLPGASTLTVGVPAGTLNALPPEILAFVRADTWRQGARFRGGVPADLYALGVLLYESLTDCHPFDPKLPVPQLVAAIETTMPPAPHELNTGAPRVLGSIAMHLLAKTPDARYPSAEALLQALWDAKKEARAHSWRVSLPLPPEGMGRRRQGDAMAEDAREAEPIGGDSTALTEQHEKNLSKKARSLGALYSARAALLLLWALAPRRVRWRVGALSVLLAVSLAWVTLVLLSQKGSVPVSTRDSRFTRLLVLLCTATGVGCPGAQVKPPESEACPEEARKAMFEVLGLTRSSELRALIDVNQPPEGHQPGTYRDGPVVGQVVGEEWTDPRLPAGTLLYGELWTGPGILWRDKPAVTGRYTRAKLPDGRTLPVCILLGNNPSEAGWEALPGSKPGAARLPRELPVWPISRWP
ncbi:serine/threonine-protein kinase [Myxococcaceae bacterium GXIMD 01537]